jgi:hydrogenase-4 membrane subunit HyfE
LVSLLYTRFILILLGSFLVNCRSNLRALIKSRICSGSCLYLLALFLKIGIELSAALIKLSRTNFSNRSTLSPIFSSTTVGSVLLNFSQSDFL